jgi:2-C-methyl-D-erythritol 4-phosphate cytidylyltransferase
MQKYAIVVAGGIGKRMEASVPKQFLEINGYPILYYSIKKFYDYDNDIKIVVVMNQNYIQFWKECILKYKISIPHLVVAGGEERFYSVQNALKILEGDGIVGIHDAVRPFVKLETIQRCFETAKNKGNAIPVIKLTDSIRQFTHFGSESVSRKNFRIVQTPQCFKLRLLKKAYQQNFRDYFTDDASVLEAFGESIHMVEGNIENIKITTPFDYQIAPVILKNDDQLNTIN